MIILRGCAKQVVVEGGGVVGLLVGEELTKERGGRLQNAHHPDDEGFGGILETAPQSW